VIDGGIQGGHRFEKSDEIGSKPVFISVSIPDLRATILHLMGLDHKQWTNPFNGCDFRLTDVSGDVTNPILA